jgi:hypothetical protein
MCGSRGLRATVALVEHVDVRHHCEPRPAPGEFVLVIHFVLHNREPGFRDRVGMT